jgi:long-chain acyl-CoA synthetase
MTESTFEVSENRTTADRGEPRLNDEPRTLSELFTGAAAKYNLPNALNYKRGGEWKKISSSEMLGRIRNIAAGLYSIGLRNGDRAAILASNSPEWTLADAGCQFAGVVDVPIYTTLSPNAVSYILNDSGSKVLFLENAESFQRIKDFLAASCVRRIVLFDTPDTSLPQTIFLSELEESGKQLLQADPCLVDRLAAAVEADDVATLIYTSGTTGEPKGVMLSHSNIISNVIDAAEKYTFSGQDISLSVLPLSHIFERTGMYLYIYFGMMVHFAESIDKVPENLQEVHPTIFIGVPRIFEKVYARAKLKAGQASRLKEQIFDWAIEIARQVALCRETGSRISVPLRIKHGIADVLVYKKLREFFGGNLRFCITGGAALSDDIFLIFTGAGIPIMQGYGLTETSPVVSSNNPSAVKVGTVGKPIRNVSVRIADDGEIEVAGPGVMLGYYKKEDATREAFTDDGWFKTGDIGALDEEGFLTITDRKKELFKTSGGKYIAPSPIEQAIQSCRFVSQVVLVGNARRFPAALVVPNFEQLKSYAKIKGLGLTSPAEFIDHPKIVDLFERQIEHVTRDLSQFEKVKKFVLIEKEFTVEGGELTPTLKVKRRVIDEKYRAVIERIYSDATNEKPGK